MRDFAIIDSSGFPIVVSKYQNFIPTPEEFLKAQENLEQFYTNHTDFVLVVDLSDVLELPGEYRVSQAKWTERNKQLAINHRIRFAFFTPSLNQQLMVKTVFAISKPEVPYTIAASFEKALAWAKKQVK